MLFYGAEIGYPIVRTPDNPSMIDLGMVADEIQFTTDLLTFWETSTVNWMIVSKVGETSFIYGENLGELIRKKIVLMEKYGDVEPYIDPNFMWRVPGYEYEM